MKADATCRRISYNHYYMAHRARLSKHDISDLPEQRLANNHHARPSVPEDVLVLRRAQERVERYRYGSYFDCAKKRVQEFRRVMQQDDDPFLRPHPAFDKSIAGTVDPRQQLLIGNLLIAALNRQVIAPAFEHISVNEVRGDIKFAGQWHSVT